MINIFNLIEISLTAAPLRKANEKKKKKTTAPLLRDFSYQKDRTHILQTHGIISKLSTYVMGHQIFVRHTFVEAECMSREILTGAISHSRWVLHGS
jgi:hypothetical protein